MGVAEAIETLVKIAITASSKGDLISLQSFRFERDAADERLVSKLVRVYRRLDL
jgi:hypothetical protein